MSISNYRVNSWENHSLLMDCRSDRLGLARSTYIHEYNFDDGNWTSKSIPGLLDPQISWELSSLRVVVVKCTLALPAEECLGAVYDYLRIVEAAWLLWESWCKKRITTRETLRGRTTREFTPCTKKTQILCWYVECCRCSKSYT